MPNNDTNKKVKLAEPKIPKVPKNTRGNKRGILMDMSIF
jgi:hypothetical protein